MISDLKNKVVVISGCSSDIGVGLCKAFADAGAIVHGCDLRPNEALDHRVSFTVVDLRRRKEASDWVHSVEEQTGSAVGVLIHNAGGVAGLLKEPFELVTDEQWDTVIDVNLGTAMAVCRAVTPSMKRQNLGAIVIIGSGAALQASLTGVQAYCAAKHGALGLTRQLAHELGPFGIRTNMVAPGFLLTTATQRQWDAMGSDGQQRLLNGVALRRFSTAQDIANAALFLGSDNARMVNGQVLSVDGGR